MTTLPWRRTAATLSFGLLLASSVAHGQTTWPTKQWPTASPKAVGLNVKVLDSIDSEIRSGRYGLVDRLLVIRHGSIAYDRSYRQNYDSAYADSVHVNGPLNPHDVTGPYNYFNSWWHPYYQRGDLHSLQSVTKTMTSIVMGIATTRGEYPSLDRTVLSFFDTTRVANIDARKRRMTLRHLVTMTSGLEWNESVPYADPRNTATKLEESSDWVKFVIDLPMAQEPGASFVYNSGATVLLGEVFKRATGKDIEEYAARYLFAPLGITRWFWKRSPMGLADTEGGLYLEARDLAKIWYVFLHDGQWEGKQIVSREWVKASVSPAIATSSAPGAPKYGLAWWLYQNPRDPSKLVWSGSGFGGQVPMIVPEDDLLVVFYAWNILPGKPVLPRAKILERISAGVTDRKK